MIDAYGASDGLALADMVARGAVSPDELLDCALERMAASNPDLNAVVHLREDVARGMIAGGLPEGPFRGVPFLLKDLGAEAVDFPTHNGSRLMADTTWTYDSEIYLRMKRTGLVPFGRTAAPEFGVGPVTEAQVYGGPTRNPWNLDRTPGGSSGGAAAAVAAGIVPVAHGSDGGGSVRIPAASCGLVGFKPTRARLPDGPMVGEGWAGMAIDGFLTRSLRDTAALLDACTGADLGAPYRAPPMQGSYAGAMERKPGALRVRVSTHTLTGEPVHPDCAEAVRKTATLCEELGHDVEEVTFGSELGVEAMMIAWTKIVACGSALTVRGALKGSALDPSHVEGITRGAIALAETISGADYLAAVNEIHAFGRRMERAFLDFDVLVTPTLAEPPIEIGRLRPDNEDFLDYRTGPGGVFEYSPYTAAFNASGQPAVSLPLHWNAANLPIGVHLAASFGEDALLMALSGQLERAAPWHSKQHSLIERGGIWT